MDHDDDLDDLLNKLERRANRLKGSSRKKIAESDSFGRLPSVLARQGVDVPRPGDAIGENYEVVRFLGGGELSAVLLVRHRGVERLFAMKLLPQAVATDPDHVERFKDEARAASMIGHENIVFVTDFGKSNRFGFYYVMEYLDGETLSARLEHEGHLSLQASVDLALSIGSALSAVHDLGIVYRDVRPKNLMSQAGDGEETWKLLDFGLSSKVVESPEALGLYSEPLYVAPEQALGGEVDARADQFSLAAVLYHVLVGHPPWPERSWTTATPEHCTRPAVEPADVQDEVSPFLQEVLFRALSAHPEDRFPDIDAFVANFQRATGRSRRPTIPPIDLQEAARAVAGYQAATSVTIGTTFDEPSEVSEAEEIDEFADPPSIEISLDMLPNARPKITVSFQHAARLRREWRRNLISGGLFVPTERELPAGAAIVAALRFAPTEEEASFPANVIDFTPGSDTEPSGLAVQIAPELRDALHKFLYELNLGLLDPKSVVRPLRDLTADAQLTSDQAFLLSRLDGPTPAGRLRGMFASLPIDLDEIVAQLAEEGWVAIEGGRKRPKSQPGRLRPDSGPGALVGENTQRQEFVRLTLQRAEFFRSQGNFLAEIETLELAAQRHDVPELSYRIALSRVQFLNDLNGAIAAMQHAVELDPDNEKYARALRDLQSFGDR